MLHKYLNKQMMVKRKQLKCFVEKKRKKEMSYLYKPTDKWIT